MTDQKPYDPSDAVAEFERKMSRGYSHTGEGFVDRDDGCHDTASMVAWLRAALLAAHAAGKREAWVAVNNVGFTEFDGVTGRWVNRARIEDAARADGAELPS